MESPGEYLKKERESRNISLTDVAGSTRIREHLLEAIEGDRYDLLPHPFYVKGYLGAYARYLGFDPNEVFLRYHGQVKDIAHPVPRQEPHARSLRKPVRMKTGGRKLSFSKWIGGVFLLLILASYGFDEVPRWKADPSEQESLLVQGKVEAQKAVEAIQKGISMIGETEARDVISTEASPFEVLTVEIGKGTELESGRSILKETCSEFSCSDQKAYFFTRIKAGREGKVTHLWYRDGKESHRAEIEVKPPAWTVYSYLTLRPGNGGNWMAELRDGNAILASRSFKVLEGSAF
jgi:hypothetical protein